MRRWPESLPTPVQDGYRLSPADQAIRTEMEVGTRRLRRISQARQDDVSLALRFSDAEFEAFRIWHGDEFCSLSGGTDSLAGWGLSGAARAVSALVGPDLVVVDALAETIGVAEHYAQRPLAAEAWAADDRVKVSAALIGIGRSLARLGWVGRDGVLRFALIDLVSWAVTVSHPELTVQQVVRGNGWRRIEVEGPVGTGATAPAMRVQAMMAPDVAVYAGLDGGHALGVAELQARRVTGGGDLWLPAAADGAALGAAGGTAWFVADLAFGGGLRRVEARALAPFDAQALPGLGWRVSWEVETRNA